MWLELAYCCFGGLTQSLKLSRIAYKKSVRRVRHALSTTVGKSRLSSVYGGNYRSLGANNGCGSESRWFTVWCFNIWHCSVSDLGSFHSLRVNFRGQRHFETKMEIPVKLVELVRHPKTWDEHSAPSLHLAFKPVPRKWLSTKNYRFICHRFCLVKAVWLA